MDLRYETALRNATKAWAHNRVTDVSTMQDLQQRFRHQPSRQPAANASRPTSTAPAQPELARYGHLGTRLNLFA